MWCVCAPRVEDEEEQAEAGVQRQQRANKELGERSGRVHAGGGEEGRERVEGGGSGVECAEAEDSGEEVEVPEVAARLQQ